MNILIVDDDKLIRTWMKLFLNQVQECELNLLEASNVEEARSIINDTHIDLMFIDIKMPGETGLDFLKELNAQHKNIKSVVLSAYDDFDYVRSALKFGAMDYILKPEMNLDDIQAILNKIRFSSMLNKKPTDDESTKYILANNNFREFLSGKLENADYAAETFPGLTDGDNICAIGLSLKIPLNDNGKIAKLCSDCERVLQFDGIESSCVLHKGSIVFVLFKIAKNAPETRNELPERIIYKLTNFISANMGNEVFYAMFRIFLNAEEFCCRMPECVQKAENDIYYYDLQNTDGSFDLDKTQQILRNIARKLEMRSLDEAGQIFKDFISSAHSARIDHGQIKSFIINIITLYYTYSDIHYDANNEIIPLHAYTARVNQLGYYTETTALIEDFIEYFSNIITKTSSVNAQINIAIEYMKNNYMNKLSLDSVAAYVFLNASYFSQLFKKQVGVSFSEYLENLRLQNAKNLLEHSSISITEISEAVGFSSQNYFTTVFKKKIGINPLKYRAIHHIQSDS